MQNLLGLDLSSEDKKLFVKDLTLYPLPIVRDDMPLYDLLNMFQLGMSRYVATFLVISYGSGICFM